MGMISEIAAENQAKQLAKVLQKAVDSRSPSIVAFCRENIYPLYLDALSEAYGPNIDKSLQTVFEGPNG
jgi:hypothetical protein